MEGVVREQRHQHLPLEDEREHDRHHDQRPAKGAGLPHVAQPGGQMPALAGRPTLHVHLGGAHREQSGQHREVGDPVDQEADRHPDGRDQDPGGGRTYDARAGEGGAVQADRVGQRSLPHHLHVEALPGWVVERRDDPGGEGERENHPQRDDVGEHDRGEGERDDGGGALRACQDPPFVEPIGEDATPGAQQQDRAERERRVDPQRGAAPGRQRRRIRIAIGLAVEPRADANVRSHARVIRALIGRLLRAVPAARPRSPGRHAPRRRAS